MAMVRLAVLSVIGALALLGLPSAASAWSATADQSSAISSPGPVPRALASERSGTAIRPTPDPAPPAPEPSVAAEDEEPTTTPAPATTSPDEDDDQEPTTTPQPTRPGTTVAQEPATTLEPETAPPEADDDQEATTTTSPAVAPRAPGRPSTSPKVRDSQIPLGSIALSLFVLTGVGAVSYRLFRRRPDTSESAQMPSPVAATAAHTGVHPDGTGDPLTNDPTPIDPATADFLVGLGEALTDAGAAVGHVESALRSVARASGADGVGVIVLPTALIVSVPNDDDLVTEIGAPGRAPLRFDQIEDVLRLVREAEAGTVGASERQRWREHRWPAVGQLVDPTDHRHAQQERRGLPLGGRGDRVELGVRLSARFG